MCFVCLLKRTSRYFRLSGVQLNASAQSESKTCLWQFFYNTPSEGLNLVPAELTIASRKSSSILLTSSFSKPAFSAHSSLKTSSSTPSSYRYLEAIICTQKMTRFTLLCQIICTKKREKALQHVPVPMSRHFLLSYKHYLMDKSNYNCSVKICGKSCYWLNCGKNLLQLFFCVNLPGVYLYASILD